MKQRILIILQSWEPQSSVVTRRWQWLGGELASAGMDVRVLSVQEERIIFQQIDKAGELQASQSDLRGVAELPTIAKGNAVWEKAATQFLVSYRLVKLALMQNSPLREFDPTLLIGSVPALPIAPTTRWIARTLKTPYVIDLRDAWPELFAERIRWNDSVEPSRIDQLVLRVPARFFSKFVEVQLGLAFRDAQAISTTTAGIAAGVARYRYPSDGNLAVIPNVFGPQTELACPGEKRSLDEGLRVLYAGTIGRAQALENLIKALKIANSRGSKVFLRVIGEGAGDRLLRQVAADLNVQFEHLDRVEPSELKTHYEWADTALVHLADWKSLQTTVPSKLFELLELGIHVTAVVDGEAAKLVRNLGAGVVVTPGDPIKLAETFIDLQKGRISLSVGGSGRSWVNDQRKLAHRTLLSLVLDSCRTT